MNDMIELPANVDLVALVKGAYALSQPQGMGFLHYRNGDLTDEQARSLIREDDPRTPVSLDYVAGRAIKFTVFRQDGKLLVDRRWYDHSESQYRDLLSRAGVALP